MGIPHGPLELADDFGRIRPVGGMGSGRSWKWGGKQVVENCVVLDARDLQRRGILAPGICNCGCTFIAGERRVLDVSYWYDAAEEMAFDLSYEVDGFPIKETLTLRAVRSPISGSRMFFLCPRTGDFVERLYLPPGERQFASRRAHNLAYESQNDDRLGRVTRKALQIRRRLGATGYLDEPFPARPRYMHRRTYEALRTRAQAMERKALQHSGALIEALQQRTQHKLSNVLRHLLRSGAPSPATRQRS